MAATRLLLHTLIITLPFGLLHAVEPAQPVPFQQAGILATWTKYKTVLSFGKNQTLALVDDGCDLSRPEWAEDADSMYPKVLITHDSVDGDDDPKHEGRGYHGSTIGIPSSVNQGNKRGTNNRNSAS